MEVFLPVCRFTFCLLCRTGTFLTSKHCNLTNRLGAVLQPTAPFELHSSTEREQQSVHVADN